MEKVKKFFKDINESKFRSLYIRNYVFAISVFLIVLFTAVLFQDLWLNIAGFIVLFYFLYITANIFTIERNKWYKEGTGIIIGYEEHAKADKLTPKAISEQCGFTVKMQDKKTYEIMLPRFELKTRGLFLQDGIDPRRWIGREITFYYIDDPSKPFHYDISKRKAESEDVEKDSEIDS